VQGVANGEAYEGAKASVHQFQIRYFGKVCVVVETSSFPKKPIAGVTFKGFPNLRSAKTDAKGGYCIPQRLKPGTAYSFTPEKIGYRFRPTVISGVVSGETPTASQSFLGIASQASSAQSKMKATGR
jgi:hypothetical protein